MNGDHLAPALEEKLRRLAVELIDQDAADVKVPAYQNSSGFWFGGGNAVVDGDGTVWVSGRYRNYGDSRTGLAAGERGLECALFRSSDNGRSFQKVRSWSKAELSYPENQVLSIEGTALHKLPNGRWELFVSSEKAIPYPKEVSDYQKPNTGIWTIDVMDGDTPETLDAARIRPVLSAGADPAWLHVKDPVVYGDAEGHTVMLFCSHPFCWSSSNTGYALRMPGADTFDIRSWQLVERGPAWDVAVTRVTERLPVPRIGAFAGAPSVSLYFYDGAECVRQHEQNQKGVQRPRGYSCEEIGGVMVGVDSEFPRMKRLSLLRPLFISPHGTGCSRYVSTVVLPTGILALWQQSQPEQSQPLVGRFLPRERVAEILA